MSRATTIIRTESIGGYLVSRTTTIVTGLDDLGFLRGEDHFQYITADSLYAVGSQHTLRTTWLNGEMVTDPDKARALWQVAGWL